MIKKLRVTVDGKSYEVTVEVPDEAEAASEPASSAPVSRASVAATPSAPAPSAKSAAAAGPGDVPSPLGGRVVAIDVKVGQEVQEGDRVITVETMKMNTFVCAPKSGKITEILVAVGDAVEEGKVLARIA